MNRQHVLVARAAAAQVAVDFVRPKHWIAQGVLAVLALLLAWAGGGWWFLFGLVVAVMLVLGFVYWVVLRIICRLGAPKHLRREMKDVSDEVRAIFEDLRLPTGPVDSVLFAVNLARGRHHERIPEAVRRIQALLSEPP